MIFESMASRTNETLQHAFLVTSLGKEESNLLLKTGNSTVTPVVSNLRIHPTLVNEYLPFAHFFLPS